MIPLGPSHSRARARARALAPASRPRVIGGSAPADAPDPCDSGRACGAPRFGLAGGAGLALLAALALPFPAWAQHVHRGVGREGRVTQVIEYVDAWEDGSGGIHDDGTKDVLSRRQVEDIGGRRTHSAQLILFGPWGHHLYAYDEERVRPGSPDATSLRTLQRAVDLDDDGIKEIVLVERSVTTRVLLDDLGVPDDEPGPYFADAHVAVRHLAREEGALVEHDVEMDATTPAAKALLEAELGGAVNAWLQIAAADADFVKQRYEEARYRYGVVREWAEAQIGVREVASLGPALALPGATPDDPAVLWMAATRRIGALPRWYQRR